MSSFTTGKIEMALDDIIQKNRTKKVTKRQKKINPVKRADHNNNNRNQNYRRQRFNNNNGRQFNNNNNIRGGSNNNFRRGGFRGGRGLSRAGFRNRNPNNNQGINNQINNNRGQRRINNDNRNNRPGPNQRRQVSNYFN